MSELNFLDLLLEEVEAKEAQMQLAHVDMVLKEISTLNSEITRILSQSEEEKLIIQDWATKRCVKLNERAEWLTKKLEVFMNEQEQSVRTIDLAHGQLLRRKQAEKIVVENLDQFLLNKNLAELTSTKPEIVQPDMNKIKAYFKMTKGKIPLGCSLVESTDKFSIKLKGGVNGTSKNGTGSEQADTD